MDKEKMKINLDKILPLVQRPGRYINHEWNSRAKGTADVKVCLCFPDLYELGASNQGLEILYNIINNREDALAERCYSIASDLEEVLKKNNLPLFSLESKTPLKEFDIVGITLQYELCATNVLNLLELSGIPFLSKDRNETFPLVIGGGPLTANPEPLADFFDAFVIGDGEEVINEIIDIVARVKGQGSRSKKELLLELAKIPGVYVPSFYSVEYKTDRTIESFKALSVDVPKKIGKRTVKLEDSLYPEKPIVPYLQTVHDRLNVEIARGCPQGCRFCQASKYYWPYRMRSKEKVLELIKNGLKSTGYEEVSLASLSCTEYKEIKELLLSISKTFSSKKISISLPSLRCDQFSIEIAANLGSGKKPNLTFAPEAGSERLRFVIGKNLTENEIANTILLASNLGWHLIKLYFMIGLPTETDEDTDAIVKLVRMLHAKSRQVNFNITISPFVPKTHTAFQWIGMCNEESLNARLKKLMKELPASVKHASIKSSKLEAVFARGDRRLSKVILRAYAKGCRFDQWKEKMKMESWMEAFKDEGLDPEWYITRNFKFEDILPWDHIVFADKKVFWDEYQKALNYRSDEKKEEVVDLLKDTIYPNPNNNEFLNKRPVSHLQLRFQRKGIVRFLSHLEQIELFRRMLRRAEMPLVYSAGFHPQPKISFGPAISVGYQSQCEYLEMELYERIDMEVLKERIAKNLPPGFELMTIKKLPLFSASLDSLVNMAEYVIELDVSDRRINEFLAQDSIIVEKVKKGKAEKIEVKPLIRQLKVENGGLILQLRFGPKKTVKPEKVVQLLAGLNDEEIKLLNITKTKLFIEKKDGSIVEP
jgi:radical SAM family uncharacterized protein/radical SAM-linked protein